MYVTHSQNTHSGTILYQDWFNILLSFPFILQKPESNEQRQNGLKMVDQAIWSKKMSNGVRRTPVSAEQVRNETDTVRFRAATSCCSIQMKEFMRVDWHILCSIYCMMTDDSSVEVSCAVCAEMYRGTNVFYACFLCVYEGQSLQLSDPSSSAR